MELLRPKRVGLGVKGRGPSVSVCVRMCVTFTHISTGEVTVSPSAWTWTPPRVLTGQQTPFQNKTPFVTA